MIEATIPRMEEYERQGRPFSVVRTHFLDDFLLLHAHEARQVVLLGAGMDTRAFRIDWPPGTHVYEIDQADVLDEKESLLKGNLPRSTRHAIRADLKGMRWVDHLIKIGFRPAEPSLWALEGLLYYLTSPEVHNLLIGINTITPKGSWLGADVINEFLLHSSDEWAKYWQSSCDDPESFFHTYGWKASAIQPGEEGAAYGRFTFQFANRTDTEAPHIFFLTASKQA